MTDIIDLFVSIDDLSVIMSAIIAGLVAFWGLKKVVTLLKKS